MVFDEMDKTTAQDNAVVSTGEEGVVSAPMQAEKESEEPSDGQQDICEKLKDILSGKVLSEDMQKALKKKKKRRYKAAASAAQQAQGTMVAETIASATVKELKQIAADNSLMQQLIDNAEAIGCKTCFDCMFEYIKDVDIFRKVVNARFGVPVGSDSVGKNDAAWVENIIESHANAEEPETEKKWTINGLIHVYRTYLRLPQSDLDLIRCLLTFNTNQVGGSGGAYDDAYRIYYLNYADNPALSADDEKNPIMHKGKFAPDSTHTRTNMVSIDMTTAHELGHIVDAQGGRYSEKFGSDGTPESGSMPAVTGWKRHTKGSDAKQLYADIKSYIKEPYANVAGITDKEKEAVDEAGRQVLLGKKYSDSGVKAEILKAFVTLKMDVADENKRAAELAEAMVLKHILRAEDGKSPCYYEDTFTELPERQIHEDYSDDNYWFSYPSAARSKNAIKISTYQFRNPGEEFAEMYASYHVSNPKGSATPEGLRKWFKTNILHEKEEEKKEETPQTT